MGSNRPVPPWHDSNRVIIAQALVNPVKVRRPFRLVQPFYRVNAVIELPVIELFLLDKYFTSPCESGTRFVPPRETPVQLGVLDVPPAGVHHYPRLEQASIVKDHGGGDDFRVASRVLGRENVIRRDLLAG